MEYTEDQFEAVSRVLNCENYFEVLRVNRNTGVRKIKKAYKELARIVHPDKNSAPGAEDAFKMINTAQNVLSNPPERIVYLRNLDYFPQLVRIRHPRVAKTHRKIVGSWLKCASIVLGLVLILLWIGFYYFSNDYSFEPSSKYSVEQEIRQLRIKYYVRKNFCMPSGDSLAQLEEEVEQRYISHLASDCSYERAQQMPSDHNDYMDVKSFEVPSCRALARLALLRAVIKT